eukprot:m.248140 g.248140  ORF g.248140 m.248140 type:complete len:102 (-) comp54482_c0_seq4:31-336(-)
MQSLGLLEAPLSSALQVSRTSFGFFNVIVACVQAILAEHVEQQAQVIDSIYADAVETNETVEAGNKEMRQAIRSSIDFQMGVFLYFLFSSCCLLFLDWYQS